MTNIDPGMTAAKRATWRDKGRRRRYTAPDTPSELLIQHKADYPQDTREERIERCIETCVANGLYYHQFAGAWFRLNYNAIVEPPPRPTKQELAERVARKAAMANQQKAERATAVQLAIQKNKKQFAESFKHEVKTALLEMVMPNGKPLGECTGADCVQLGGWFAKIGQRIQANQKIKDALSDKQVAKLLQNAAS